MNGFKNRILQGDCIEVLRTMPDNSVDSVVTDPPYGLSKEPDIREVLTKWMAGEDYEHRGGGFMGKSWDSFVPGPSVWREVYRVLKPGGHALVFAGTRTQDLMTISLRIAGFEVRDVVEWLYFSGFPKSMDVGKAFDRRAGAERETKRIPYTRDVLMRSGGQNTRPWMEKALERGYHELQGDEPVTELARKWDGWGTNLKPSHEPVILGKKPLPLNYKLGILVMETITRILGGPICRRLNVSVSDAARLFMYFLPQLERVGVNTVAESVKIRNWASGEFVRLVERNFTPNDPELNEENLNTVQKHAPILLEGVKVKKTPTGKADDLNERTDTLLSEPMTESIGLNMMLSWSNILAALLKKASMFTTETESKMITELKTLNWLLGQNTQKNTTQANGILNAGLPCDATTVDAILSDVKRKCLDTENSFAQELVISRGNEQESQTDHQPIIMARKPLEGTVADNVEKYGTGALNIDGCRIGDEEIATNGRGSMSGVTPIVPQKVNYVGATHIGRFPANCVTTDPDAFYSKYFNVTPAELSKKASKKDRNSDWRGEEIALEPKETDSSHFYGGLPDLRMKSKQKRLPNANNHPTVKPTDLMAWLVRLSTPPGGTVLDPFAGSGSTLVAAKREGFDYIGIEREPEYVEIAKARTGSRDEVKTWNTVTNG